MERVSSSGSLSAVRYSFNHSFCVFELFETEDAHEKIEEIVYRSLVMKKNVVERDEREAGLRATLNFGHTLGHAIERAARGPCIKSWACRPVSATMAMKYLNLSVTTKRPGRTAPSPW